MSQLVGQVPKSSTLVSFFRGEIEDTGHIVLLYSDETRNVIVCDRSPFHPQDNIWPDQPGDTGRIVWNDTIAHVSDTVTWPIYIFDEDPVFDPMLRTKRQDENYIFLTAHIVRDITTLDQPTSFSSLLTSESIGIEVQMQVDEDYRQRLNRAHSASHLMGLALNKATARLWLKDTVRDTLGNPHFERATLQESRIYPGRSVDVYRIGKSLRKSGFDTVLFMSDLPRLEGEVAQTLNQWITEYAAEPITIQADSDLLNAQRRWTSKFGDIDVSMPCGGTHPKHIGDVGPQNVTFSFNQNSSELTITTSGIADR